MEQAHAKTWQEVVDYFNTDSERGLSEDQVRKYQEKYGPNGKYFFSFLFSLWTDNDSYYYSLVVSL